MKQNIKSSVNFTNDVQEREVKLFYKWEANKAQTNDKIKKQQNKN